MPYKTAEEFLKNMKSKKANGVNYYTVTQVANGLGVDWRIVCRVTNTQDLEKRLGFEFVENTFNRGKYFPPEAIVKLYKFKDELFREEEY